MRQYTETESIPVKTEITVYITHLHKIYSPRTVKRKIPQPLPRTISLTVIENILRVAYQELCSLNANNIDLVKGSILIMGKGAKERVLQIGNPEVLSILRRYAKENIDIRYIQRMLGHSSNLTTQIYTQVTVEKQRQILTTKHPRNRLVVGL